MLSYYSTKDNLYSTLTQLSKKSLFFLRKNYKKIENDIQLKHANERMRFIQVKSIEEHNSGVNQMLRIN